MRTNLIKILALLLCFTIMAVVNVSAQTITTNQTGYDGGYYYSFWSNTPPGSASMNLNGGGSYSANWTNCGDVICGKGWNPGSGHTITFSGSYTSSGLGAFGIYGWTKEPSIEYYIVEKTGSQGGPAGPTGGTLMGTVTSDGGTYTIYKLHHVDLLAKIVFDEYIDIRQSQRTSGTITIQNHFNAWKNLGMNLGSMDYQLFIAEGENGSGSASCTISETSNQSPTPTPTQRPNTPTPTGRRF